MQATVTETRSDVAVLRLSGELDADTATRLHELLAELLERQVPRIVVDLSDLKFCDSVGLSAFITARQVITARGGWLEWESWACEQRRPYRPDFHQSSGSASCPRPHKW